MVKDENSAGSFRPVSKVVIIVQDAYCDRVYTPNEVITMYPTLEFETR